MPLSTFHAVRWVRSWPGLILGVEIGDRELHRLPLRQRLAESDALLCVLADHLETTLGDAEAVRRLVHAVARNPGLRLAHALAFLANEVLDRNLHVVERDLVGDVAHHVMVLAHDREAFGIHVDDEYRESAARSFLRVGRSDELQKISALGMRDEALVAVDDIVVAVANGARLHAAGIAAGLGLGLREGCGFLATQQRIEVLLLHLLRQPQQDRTGRGPEHTVAAVGQRDGAAAPPPRPRRARAKTGPDRRIQPVCRAAIGQAPWLWPPAMPCIRV